MSAATVKLKEAQVRMALATVRLEKSHYLRVSGLGFMVWAGEEPLPCSSDPVPPSRPALLHYTKLDLSFVQTALPVGKPVQVKGKIKVCPKPQTLNPKGKPVP